MSDDNEEKPTKAKRIFKRFKLGELSLVDEPCVPGSDVVVIKAKGAGCPTAGCTKLKGHAGDCGSTGTGESATSPDNEEPMAEKPDQNEVRKRLEPLGALNDALAADEITPSEYVAKARALVAALEDETRDGEPVQKMAAAEAATIIAETAMTLAEMTAALDTANEAIKTVEKRNKELEGQLAEVTKARETVTAERDAALEEVKKAKKEPEAEPTEEDVLKALPAPMRAIVEKAKKLITDTEARETETLTERAVAKGKKLGVKDPDAFGKALVEVRKSHPEHATVIESALEQAAAVAAESATFKSLGYVPADQGGASEDPEAELQAKAAEIRKAKPTLSKEEAYAEAVEANPALYNQYVAKRRNLNPSVAH